FSVHVAAEFTSAAAPRTVLHATIASDAATIPTATNFRTIVAPPFGLRNDNESSPRQFVHRIRSALPAVHRVLGAVRDRIDVSRSTADRVASGKNHRSADQHHR